MNKNNNFLKLISLTIILALLFFCLTFLFSCKNINSPFDLNDSKNDSSVTVIGNQSNNIEDREVFNKLKSSQADKNPLNNLNTRKAIFFAIDRERIVKELFGDNNKVLNSLFCGSSFFNKSSWDKYSYNPEKAKEFLSLAGYSTEKPLYLTIGASDSSPARLSIENIIKENLNDIGIILWIENKPSNEWYGNIVKNGNFELGIWSLYTFEPASLVDYLSSMKIPVNETATNKNCNNFYWYKDENADQLLNKIDITDNINEIKNTADAIQDTVSENAIILPLFSRLFAVAHNKEMDNVQLSTIDGNYFKNAENWTLINTGESKKNTIIAGMSSEPNTLNPFLEENTSMDYINSILLKGLWSVGENSFYQPELVEENAGVLTGDNFTNIKKIKLKDNIYWEDGSEITAYDVKATVDAVISDKSILRYRSDFEKIEKIEVANNKELSVYFAENVKDWKKMFLYIFPKKDLDKSKLSNLYENDIFGSGPYKFKEWSKGEYILLELNKNYYGKKPFFNEIEVIFKEDDNILIDSLKNGDIDIMSIPVDLKLIEDIKSNSNLSLMLKEGNLWEQLAICLKTKE